ncbi:MAG TPA: YeeE/YedE family protein [Candidatus Binatia bacterium]|nr:YeeE/YedE family protein [Candidatus Binatia bacterium]
MQRASASLLAGVLFGAGLTISRMVNPAKVIGFLDFFGRWDPSLAFVMGSALVVTFACFRFILRRPHPLFALEFRVPSARRIDSRLIGGSALFGIGWGLAGYCPGPAVASLAYGRWQSATFVLAMIVGMALGERWGVPNRAPAEEEGKTFGDVRSEGLSQAPASGRP